MPVVDFFLEIFFLELLQVFHMEIASEGHAVLHSPHLMQSAELGFSKTFMFSLHFFWQVPHFVHFSESIFILKTDILLKMP